MEAKKLEKIMPDASRKRLLPRDVHPKKLEYVHVNHDSPADVRAWQEREKRVIARYRHKGYTWEDEAHYGMDMDSHVRFFGGRHAGARP